MLPSHISSRARTTSTQFAAAALLSLLATTQAFAEKTSYPVTLENCGRQVTINQAPHKTVSIGQSTTEILYLLGLNEKIVGTALWIGPVLKGYEEVNAKIERLANNEPSFESVVAKKPDLVIAQFEWMIGSEGVVATPQQFEELAIPVYISPSDCIGKDNSNGGDGVRRGVFTMDLIYQEIGELAKIYDVQEQGAKIIAELKEREDAARQKISVANDKISAVFWFSSADKDIDPYVAGSNGAPGYIMKTLGVRNIVDSEEEWPTVGWETIAKANPTFIVAGKLDRRRFPADDIAVKQEFLAKDPVASLIPAVKDKRVVVLDAQAMNPTIRTIEGIEVLADAIAQSSLNK